MRVLCAWCVKEGKPALIGEKEPVADVSETHGLCPDHRKALEAEIAEYRRMMKALEEKVDP
jgi:hypothetical protein